MRFGVFLAIGLLAFISPASADCVSDCQASTYCGGDSWECAQLQSACYRSKCGTDSASPQVYAFGAIAYDEESGAWGLADASADETSARRSATKFCSENGEHCEIVASFSNTCAAVAQDEDGKVAGWADNNGKQTAIEKAIASCNRKASRPNCHVARTNCFGP